jgi:NAD-dependent DNA ligase
MKNEKFIFSNLRLPLTPIEIMSNFLLQASDVKQEKVVEIVAPKSDENVDDELAEKFQTLIMDVVPEIKFANEATKEALQLEIQKYSNAYHNGEELITDDLYNLITDVYERRFGLYTVVGASAQCDRVPLSSYMGSLDKIKNVKELKQFAERLKKKFNVDLDKVDFIFEVKLDGITLFFEAENVNSKMRYKMTTRGNGKIGGDMNHTVNDIVTASKLPLPTADVEIRGEAIMLKHEFAKYARSPFNPKGKSNPRACVAGAFNSQESYNPNIIKDCRFICYRLVNRDDLKPSQQRSMLKDLGATTPISISFSGSLFSNPEALHDWLRDVLFYWKIKSEFELDGGVIYLDLALPYPDDKCPEHVIAFKPKFQDAIKTTIIKEIEWFASKDRILAPVAVYEKIPLYGEYGSVTYIERALLDTAKNVFENGYFPGACIEVFHSGSVIPRAHKAITKGEIQWPDPNVHGYYEWQGPHLVLLSDSKAVIIRKILHFFVTMSIENVKESRVTVMYEAGLTSIHAIVTTSIDFLASLDRMGVKTATKIYNGMWEALTTAPLAKIMAASSCLGRHFGYERCKKITDVYPTVCWMVTDPELVNKIRSIGGFNELADQFVKNLPVFNSFIMDCQALHFIFQRPVGQTLAAGTGPLSGMGITPSGFDNPNFRKEIESMGATYEDGITKSRTKLLVILNDTAKKGKYNKAIGWNISVMTYREFKTKYGLQTNLSGM